MLNWSTEIVVLVVLAQNAVRRDWADILRPFQIAVLTVADELAAIDLMTGRAGQQIVVDAVLVVDAADEKLSKRVASRVSELSDDAIQRGGFRLRHLPLVVVSDIARGTDLPDDGRNIPIMKTSAAVERIVDKLDDQIRRYRTAVLRDLQAVGPGFAYHDGRLGLFRGYSFPRRGPLETTYLKVMSPTISSDTGAAFGRLLLVEDRLSTARKSIDRFRLLIESEGTREEHLQDFLDHHPEFLSPEPFMQHWSQPSLKDNISGQTSVPDFVVRALMVPRMKKSLTVVDLKRPQVPVLAGRRSHRKFSEQVHQVITQLRDYEEHFTNPANRDELEQVFGPSVRSPNLTAVIGRLPEDPGLADRLEELRDRDGMGMSITTYDEMLMEREYRFETTRRRLPALDGSDEADS